MIPLRVLLVTDPRDASSTRAGPASLLPWLVQGGHAVAAVGIGAGDPPQPSPLLGSRLGTWAWWRRDRQAAVRAAAAWGADIVHAVGEGALATGLEIARRITAPFVAEPCSLIQVGTERLLRDPWVSIAVLPSEDYRARAIGEGRLQRDRVTVVPPGVDARLPTARPVDGSLSVAMRLGPDRHGLPTLIAAVAQLREGGLAVSALVGTEPDRFERVSSACARAGLGPEACRPVARAEALAGSDVLVELAAGDPPFAHVVEALAAGRPVIAAADGALPEVVEDGRSGVLVTPDDPRALAGALRQLASAERRGAMSARALQAARRFGIGLVGEAMVSAYRAAIGGDDAGSGTTWKRLSTERLQGMAAPVLDVPADGTSSRPRP